MQFNHESPWRTCIDEEAPDESVTDADLDAGVIAGLVAQGYGPMDVADVFRRGGWSRQRLIHAVRQCGYTKFEFAQALRHFNSGCPHECGGDVGTLPSFPSRRPDLLGSDDDIVPVARDAWAAIRGANDPPQFFNYWGQASWVKVGPNDPAAVEPITVDRMMFLMGNTGSWYRITRDGQRPCRPPKAVATHLAADPHPPLPRLNRLVSTPVFDADGSLVARAGYHAESGLFLATQNLVVPPVAHTPTAEEIAKAKDILFELVHDFPFVDQSDEANAVALLILPFVRDLVSGPTPLHLVTKPTAGSGGTLLVQALLYPALGRRVESQTVPPGGSEIQRRITAALMTAPEAILFDNLKGPLDSDHVASVLTAEVWRDRVISTSGHGSFIVKNVWVATGNDARVSDEIARRTVPIRLDPQDPRPWDRTDFRHDDLIGWAADNRGDLIWAALTLIQAWVAEGMPHGSVTVGMFESWSRTISGIFEVVGIPGLRENWEEWFDDGPSEEKRRSRIVEAWRDEFGTDEVKAVQLLPVLGPHLDIEPDSGRSSQTMLGGQLKKLNGECIDGYEIVGRPVSGSMSWRLIHRG